MSRLGAQLAAAAFVVLLTACGDRSPTEQATIDDAVVRRPQAVAPRANLPPEQLPPECADSAASQLAIAALLPQLYKPGNNGQRGTAQGINNEMEKAKKFGQQQLARLKMEELINLTLKTYYANNLIGGQSAETQARVLRFIYLLYCSNNIQPVPDLSGIFGAVNTTLVRPVTPDTVVRDNQGQAGVKIDQGDVPDVVDGQPFFGTFVSIVRTSSPLPTDLDWYGVDGFKAGAFEFVASPAVVFDEPVLTGVCLSYDDAIVTSPTDIRLAHQVDPLTYTPAPGGVLYTSSAGSIEILEPKATDPLDLACDPLPLPVAGLFGKTRALLANAFLPPILSAGVAGGSRGGDVRTFSPFAGVDRVLATSGSAPSSATIESPATSTTVTAEASVRTRHPSALTPIAGVTMTFAPSGSFSPSSGTTSSLGSVTSQWTLVAGSNSGSATPSRTGLLFTPASVSYSATATVVSDVVIVTPSPLPDAQRGQAYSQALTATGGIGTYAWSVTGGALPAGLSLSPAGVISGTPTVAGVFNFTAQVTSGPKTASQAYQLTVALPAITSLTLQWTVQPGNGVCKNPLVGPPTVSVRDQEGNLRPGISVSIAAVDNNGTPTTIVPQTPVVTDASGLAVFSGYRVTKTGAVRLVASVTTPVSASVRSNKANLSPPCQ